jgi:hypothetical protein
MSRKFFTICLVLILAMVVPAYADNFTVTSYSDLTAWYDTPQVKCTATPSATDAATAETNWGTGQQIGQVFMVPQSILGPITLDKIALKLSGPTCTLNVKLYDLWAGDNSVSGSHAYGNGNQGTLSPVDLAIKGTLLINDTWAYAGSANPMEYVLDFLGAEEVSLVNNEKYMLVLGRGSSFSSMTLYRNGAYSYTDGDIYRDNSSNGTTMAYVNGAGREGAMAVYLTPEPATMVLLGLGGLALIRRKR